MVKLIIFGDPVAQGRPRATTINGKARVYDPRKSRDYKNYIRMEAAKEAPQQLIENPVVLHLSLYRSIPKSFSKKKTELAEQGKIRPTTKPDASNYLKLVEDALNGVIWKDDAQIVRVLVDKYYSSKPRIEIEIEELR